MSRYGDMDYFMSLDFFDGIGIIHEALQQRERKDAWDVYLVQMASMTADNFVLFDEYWKRPVSPKEVEKQTKKTQKDREKYAIDAIAMAEQIKKAYQNPQN
jgi:hypothetical protein